MGDAAAYAYVAMQNAITDAGLSKEQVAKNPRVGVIAGSGGASTANICTSRGYCP
jgi:3-oxoacyl-[acyl-carrier-protein] synthase-1